MKTFNFEKQGIKFSFRNPKWDNFYRELRMEWKVEGIQENKKNDGYYYNSSFLVNKNAMELNGVKVNGKEVKGVILPEDILTEVKALYEQLKNEDLQKRINSNVKYQMNDNTAYGIYNGISESSIKDIIYDIVKQNNSTVNIDTESIKRILNKDEELKQIAIDTYIPYPMNENWRDEIKEKYPKWVKNKTAEGYGLIPNQIIRERLTPILLDLIKKDNIEKTKKEEENKVREIRKAQFKVLKVYKHINPKGREDGTDGYYDANITDGNNTVRFVARNVFDFGYYTYPKRVEGTDEVLEHEKWTEFENKISSWLNEFSPFTTSIRM